MAFRTGAGPVVRFSVFELDLRSGELRKSGLRVPLQDQPLEILKALLERAGELVTREELRQRLWRDDTFVDFEDGLNAAIRRLREALGDSATTPRFVETLPRRGYRFIASVVDDREVGLSPGGPVQQPPHGDGVTRSRMSWRQAFRWAAVLLGALAAIASIAVWGGLGRPLPSPSVNKVSSERWTGRASFSPDGSQIAYASAGDDGVNWDIWLKIIGQTEARQLTTDSAAEGYPAWSPDGNWIAFLRYFSGVTRGPPFNAAGVIQVVSPLGGESRRISEFPARSQLSWSVDGRWLAAAKAGAGAEPPGGIHLISVETGEVRPLTVPKKPGFDLSPAFSPDGRTLAYMACDGGNRCELSLQTLDADLRLQGEPRLASTQKTAMGSVAWTRDGGSVLYHADYTAGIWRVRVDGSAPPERLELAADGEFPSTAAKRDRLVYLRGGDTDLYRLQIGGTSAPFVQSTFSDSQAQYSNDGRRVALVAFRSGRPEIWLANADGSNVMRLTHGPGLRQQYPNWSPDDKWIVFNSVPQNGERDIWAIGASGSGLRQITSAPGDDMNPSWSRDGRHIYFTSNRTGRGEIWRIPADGGGPEEQLTQEGGIFAFESLDGAMLYYKRAQRDTELLGRPIGDGEERVILPCVPSFGYAVVKGGIVHHDCGSQDFGASARRTLYLWEEATGLRRAIGSVEADWLYGLTVSPDGKYIIYGRGIGTADLMMIENFR